MYKSKLQELCQKKQWSLPHYSTSKGGPSHIPRFTTTVSVNGLSFDTPIPARSSKESQNEAARIALERLADAADFSPSPSSSSETVSESYAMGEMLASLVALQPKLPEDYPSPGEAVAEGGQISEAKVKESCAPQLNESIPSFKDDTPVGEVWHLCKNQLQMYAQKRNLPLPIYSCDREGPPHASRFKCKVNVDGKIFESPDFCGTLKFAEHAAARVALLALSPTREHESDTGLYKSLLQEFAQKEGYHLPVYETSGSAGILPTFYSTVVIAGERFMGQQAKTKKQAEMSAAKVAYTTLKERKQSQTSLFSDSKTSSAFPSPIATSGIPSRTSPNEGSVSDFNLLGSKNAISGGEDTKLKNSNALLSSDEAETTSPGGKAPSYFSTRYDQIRNMTLEENLSESPSRSESSTDSGNGEVISAIETPGEEVTLPPQGVVRIYPWTMNFKLPEGSAVVHSDEKWIAITAGCGSN